MGSELYPYKVSCLVYSYYLFIYHTYNQREYWIAWLTGILLMEQMVLPCIIQFLPFLFLIIF